MDMKRAGDLLGQAVGIVVLAAIIWVFIHILPEHEPENHYHCFTNAIGQEMCDD